MSSHSLLPFVYLGYPLPLPSSPTAFFCLLVPKIPRRNRALQVASFSRSIHPPLSFFFRFTRGQTLLHCAFEFPSFLFFPVPHPNSLPQGSKLETSIVRATSFSLTICVDLAISFLFTSSPLRSYFLFEVSVHSRTQLPPRCGSLPGNSPFPSTSSIAFTPVQSVGYSCL